MKVFEAIVAEISQKFEHWLKDHLGIEEPSLSDASPVAIQSPTILSNSFRRHTRMGRL